MVDKFDEKRVCDQCNMEYKPKRWYQRFCCAACGRTWNNDLVTALRAEARKIIPAGPSPRNMAGSRKIAQAVLAQAARAALIARVDLPDTGADHWADMPDCIADGQVTRSDGSRGSARPQSHREASVRTVPAQRLPGSIKPDLYERLGLDKPNSMRGAAKPPPAGAVVEVRRKR